MWALYPQSEEYSRLVAIEGAGNNYICEQWQAGSRAEADIFLPLAVLGYYRLVCAKPIYYSAWGSAD